MMLGHMLRIGHAASGWSLRPGKDVHACEGEMNSSRGESGLQIGPYLSNLGYSIRGQNAISYHFSCGTVNNLILTGMLLDAPLFL